MKFGFSSINGKNIKKGMDYLKSSGVDGILSQMKSKMTGPGFAYNSWYHEKHEADVEELSEQRGARFAYEPVISILVPIYMTPEFSLRAMIESVQAQTYGRWQLCIVDGSPVKGEDTGEEVQTNAHEKVYRSEIEKMVHQYMEEDARVNYQLLEINPGIADSINIAMEMAEGEYIALMDHDDMLTEDALFCVVRALQEMQYDFLYTDEDKVSENGKKFSAPIFKPDFSIDLLRTYNYIRHFMIVKKELAKSLGGFRREFDGAQNYDFVLRCSEVTRNIKHIPRVLYHYRLTNRSVQLDAQKREYATEAGKRALMDHIKRLKSYATVSETEIEGFFKVSYETPGNPLVSIILPGTADLKCLNRCIQPLYENSRYSNFEIIIVDTDGENKENLTYYHRLENGRKNIRAVIFRQGKYLPSIRNFGAEKAKGKYLLFLDSNLEVIDGTAIGEMLGLCMREDVGVVSGTLYNDNDTIYRQGIFVGVNGLRDFPYVGIKKGMNGYLMHNRINADYSAVPASCMMVSKGLFERLGGFSERFTSELAEIDFCLRVRERNQLVVCAADAGWYYHVVDKKSSAFEKSDGHFDLNIQNMEAHQKQEMDLFQILWGQILHDGDPYYNPNLTRKGELFALAE